MVVSAWFIMTPYPSSITVSKDWAGRYFVSMICDFAPIKLPKSKNTVGADLGLKHLSVTCKGHKEPNLKYTKQYATELAYYQRKTI